jgi:glycosyltransferase involved in cell wall biosynthesis
VNEPDERRARGRAARADALDRFSWPALAGRLAEVFDEVAVTGRGPAA